MLFSLLGGLGLFIYGMKQMADGLQKTAGKKLKELLGMLTTNRIAGLLVGTGVTAIIQSSSATTVMVVGFVNAGLMTIKQSIGVIMGANIGTTITAQLIAFKLSHYSLHAIAIGASLYLFAKKDKTKQIGQVLLGFGILFLGLTIMKDTMRPLRDSDMFIHWMENFTASPILGVLLGTVMTVMVQSSSASMGILMSLLAVGVIDYHAAVPVLLGDNIGTTITALLSSIGASRNAKRSAAAHMIFNVIGTATFLVFLYLVPNLPELLEQFFSSSYFGSDMSATRMLANTHSAFNILNALIWLPFVGGMVKIVNWIMPGEEKEVERGLTYLDERMLETPSVAVEQLENEVLRMLDISSDMVRETIEGFGNGDMELIKSVHKKEEVVNELEEQILVFLTKIPHNSLSEEDIRTINMYFAVIDAIESIADDADELAKLTMYREENNIEYSEAARDSINEMSEFVFELLDKTYQLLESKNVSLIYEIISGEEKVDNLQLNYRNAHTERLNQGECIPGAAVVYLEALESIEHISDQTADIAHSINEM